MTHEYVKIDMETWKRKAHCQRFMDIVQPQYRIGVELDVTNFKSYIKEKHLSFTLAFTFAVSNCANGIEELRYRFIGDSVVLYGSIDTVFTYLDAETELFKFVSVPMQDTMDKYVHLAEILAKNQKEYFPEPVENDVFMFSALPWLSWTQVSNTDYGDNRKAQPRFCWGKYFERAGRYWMPFSVQVHHSFVDGIHIAKLMEKLQCYVNELGKSEAKQ
ncbi:MAG: chloramphenicol acetyltransferase [Desulfovibrionaceae bacterium]